MSILKVETGTTAPNFLDSAVGLVTKTRQIPQTLGTADGKYKTVFAGTVFPADDAGAKGIVFADADVTDGDAIGPVLVAGRVLKARLTVSDAALAALSGQGISFVDENGDVVKPDASMQTGSGT